MNSQRHAEQANLADAFDKARGVVVTYFPTDPGCARRHDGVTQASIAGALAAFKGYHFAGEYDSSSPYPARVYFVPSDTLVGIESARILGVGTEDDLFGGVVPYPFVATKAITHPLVEPDAAAPEGWSQGFGLRVRKVVLPGFTAFSLADAQRAGIRLLRLGPCGSSPAAATAGAASSWLPDPLSLRLR